ncbi:hypothetical protein IGI04_023595, partial [Brassica rapa subsp. trilocularis]
DNINQSENTWPTCLQVFLFSPRETLLPHSPLANLKLHKQHLNVVYIMGKIQNSPCTIICFDYGGYYIKDETEMKWISGDGEGEDEIHTIVFKKSVDEITYSALVERICRKIRVDGYKMETKISNFSMVLYSNKLSYIWNDEDVFGYLLQVNHEKCR